MVQHKELGEKGELLAIDSLLQHGCTIEERTLDLEINPYEL